MKLKYLFNSGGCPICQGEPLTREGICIQCKDHLEIINEKIFLPLDCIEDIYVTMVYTKLTQELVHRFKFSHDVWLAKIFAHFLVQLILQYKLHRLIDTILFVPMNRYRYNERGYNQSELLVQEVNKLLGRKENGGLEKLGKGKPQLGLSEQERVNNVKGSFRATRNFKAQNVLIIDDVVTTGSTLNACAEALKKAGAKQIYGLTLAKAGLMPIEYKRETI